MYFSERGEGVGSQGSRENGSRSNYSETSNYSARSPISERLHNGTERLKSERNRAEAIQRAERSANIRDVDSGRMKALERAMKHARIKNTLGISELLNSSSRDGNNQITEPLSHNTSYTEMLTSPITSGRTSGNESDFAQANVTTPMNNMFDQIFCRTNNHVQSTASLSVPASLSASVPCWGYPHRTPGNQLTCRSRFASANNIVRSTSHPNAFQHSL